MTLSPLSLLLQPYLTPGLHEILLVPRCAQTTVSLKSHFTENGIDFAGGLWA